MVYAETDFVKKLRKEHCQGCMNGGDESYRWCNGQKVIHCYLVEQYIPNDEWRKTVENDILNEQTNNVESAINNEIIKEILKQDGMES